MKGWSQYTNIILYIEEEEKKKKYQKTRVVQLIYCTYAVNSKFYNQKVRYAVTGTGTKSKP